MNKRSPSEKRRRCCAPQAESARLYDTPNEFARKAHISRATVWRLMKGGRLRYARFGRVRRIPISEYERLTSDA